jgi:hypothetical protein
MRIAASLFFGAIDQVGADDRGSGEAVAARARMRYAPAR